MTIVQATNFTQKDYQTLFAYHKEHIKVNFPDSLYREDLFKAQLEHDLVNPHALFFFAKDKGKIQAFLWLRIEQDPYKEPSPYHYLDLHYIHVDTAQRSKGIGSQLMEKVITVAKEKNCREIRLGTHAQNVHAQNLYKKFGFTSYRVIMRRFI